MANITLQCKPLANLRVTSKFGPRKSPGGIGSTYHKGIDYGAPTGTPIYAALPGTVTLAGYSKGFGNIVKIDHGNGVETRYAHQSKIAVSKGAKVAAGTVIGYVGSTGNSTGPHLHFEVRINGTAVNPEPLVNGTPFNPGELGSSATTGAIIDGSSAKQYTTINDTYETAAKISTQPFNAVVDLWIGNQHLPNIPPQYILSLEHTVTSTEGTGTVILSLYDKYSDEVERLILQYGHNIVIRYGNVNGRQSKTIRGSIYNYNVINKIDGNILSLNIRAMGDNYNIDNISLMTSELGQSPSEAVKSICRKQGWKEGRIDDAVQMFESTQVVKNFSIINERPIDYIRGTIAPRACRKSDGKTGYRFYFDTTVNPPTANFHPIDIETTALRTYVYQKGKNGPMLDFKVSSIQVQEVALEINGVDPVTKEEYSYSKGDTETNKKTIIDSKGMTYEEAKAIVDYRFEYNLTSTGNITASATLIGDPTLEILQSIRIIILNRDSSVHHTSGVYWIKGISHSVNSGVLNTSLDLVKLKNWDEGAITLKSE